MAKKKVINETPDYYGRSGRLEVGPDTFWFKKWSKLNQDKFERTYHVLRRTVRYSRLIQRQNETQAAIDNAKISREEYREDMAMISADLEKLEEEMSNVITTEVNGKEIEILESFYASAEKLSYVVYVPLLDENGKIISKDGVPQMELKPVEYWLEAESTLVDTISAAVDSWLSLGYTEPISAIDEVIDMFLVREDIPDALSKADVVALLTTLRDEYVSGDRYRKKSESAYGVQMHPMT
jgi:hypothetical protein